MDIVQTGHIYIKQKIRLVHVSSLKTDCLVVAHGALWDTKVLRKIASRLLAKRVCCLSLYTITIRYNLLQAKDEPIL